MKIVKNPDSKKYEQVTELVKNNDGYCPCMLFKTEDTKCMCKEFRDQIKDPDYEGFCHCMLYYKYKDQD